MYVELYKVLSKICIDVEDMKHDYGMDNYTLNVNERYFVRFDDHDNEFWPQIYIPLFGEWFNVFLFPRENKNIFSIFPDGCIGEVVMVLAEKEDWTDHDDYVYRQIMK